MRLQPLLFVTITLALSASASAEDDAPALPLAAARIMENSARAELHLDQEYKQKLIDEQTKVNVSLDKILKEQMRDGNADGAVAVKKAMKRLSELIASEKQSVEFSQFSEDDIARMLMATDYDFQFPSGHRTLKFGEHGVFREGSNQNENTWKVVGLQLEIYNASHAVFSRWNFDSSTNGWNNVKDKDVICQQDLKLTPLKDDDTRN
jgi:hypothetical protein